MKVLKYSNHFTFKSGRDTNEIMKGWHIKASSAGIRIMLTKAQTDSEQLDL